VTFLRILDHFSTHGKSVSQPLFLRLQILRHTTLSASKVFLKDTSTNILLYHTTTIILSTFKYWPVQIHYPQPPRLHFPKHCQIMLKRKMDTVVSFNSTYIFPFFSYSFRMSSSLLSSDIDLLSSISLH
jgi:hypothetical protein